MARKGPLAENRKAPPERVLFAVDALRKMSYGSVVRALMEQFTISRTTAVRAISMARVELKVELDRLWPYRAAELTAEMKQLFYDAKAAGDFRAAVGAGRELRALYELGPGQTITINNIVPGERMADLTDEQLDALAELDATSGPRDVADAGDNDGSGGLPH